MFGEIERPDWLPEDHWIIHTSKRAYRVTEEHAREVMSEVNFTSRDDMNKTIVINDLCGIEAVVCVAAILQAEDSTEFHRNRDLELSKWLDSIYHNN